VKQTKFQHKKQFIQNEKKLEKKHYGIIIGLIIFTVVYHYFIEPKTIGEDIRYSIYIFWIPTIIGMLTLGIYRRQFLLNRFATNKGFVLWSFMTFLYLLQGFLFSFISFGQIAKMSWDYANFKKAKQNVSETLHCEVIEVWTTKQSNYLSFTFDNRRETFNVSNQFIKDYQVKKNKNYKLEINARKGIWNYYLVDNWEIEMK
jgi:hypothetical protein